MSFIEVRSQKIHFLEMGTGRPALLLIHAAGGGAQTFYELMRPLARSRRVVALDLPGHGQSPDWPAPLASTDLLANYRDIVADFAEKIGLGKFVLAGHSMGGAVAQLFALAYPDRLNALFILASSSRLKVAPAIFEIIREQPEQIVELMANLGYSPASDRTQVANWARAQLQTSSEILARDLTACLHHDQRQAVKTITLPTLVLIPADDRMVSVLMQEQFAASLPAGTAVRLPRAGHFFLPERPTEAAQILENALMALPHKN